MKKSKYWLNLETIRRLIRKDAGANLRNLLKRLHSMDIAAMLSELSPEDMITVFQNLESDTIRAEVLSGMESETATDLLDSMEVNQITLLLKLMAPDDAAALLDMLPEERSKVYQENLSGEELDQVEDLLTYPEETAGRIMTPQVFALQSDLTVRDAMKRIHSADRAETVFYLYIVDEHNKLLGVVSLRRLVLEKADVLLKDIMLPDAITVSPDLDQEEVAQIVARYDLLAIPVVDNSGFLLGIITVDDIIDILHEEAREDIYRLAGSNLSEYDMRSPMKMAGVRMKWLLLRFAGAAVAGLLLFAVVSRTVSDPTYAWFACLLPLYLSLIGGIGLQSSTIVSEQMGYRTDQNITFWPMIRTEILIGLIMGIMISLIPGLAMFFLGDFTWQQSLCAGLFLSLGMLCSVTTGTVLPYFFFRLGKDPAIVSGSIMSSALDIVGIAAFIASLYFMESII